MQKDIKEYEYIDVTHKDSKGFFTPWKRIKIEDIDKFIKIYHNRDIFETVQRFANIEHIENEEYISGLYFDLDSSDSNGGLEKTIQETMSLASYLYDISGLRKEDIRIYFSGSRGFHVIVPFQVLGIKPRKDSHLIIKNIAYFLKDTLRLETIDLSIYSVRRMWRVPDTIHSKTGLYCIELDIGELNKSISEIKEIAKKPRGPLYDFDAEANPEAVEWFNDFVIKYENTPIGVISPIPIDKITTLKEDPSCIIDLLENGIRKSGSRINAVMCLASYYRDRGYSEDKVRDIVVNFTYYIPEELTGSSIKEREAHAVHTIKTFFKTGQKYTFHCSFIRALGTKDSPIICDSDCSLNQRNKNLEIIK